MAFDHFLLHGMEFVIADEAFDGDNFSPSHKAERNEATVYGAVRGPTAGIAIDNSHRARSAIAFGTTFLGACGPG